MKLKYIFLCALFLLAFAYSRSDIEIFTMSQSEDLGTILVIDAGHGGLDGGAVSPNGILEADITIEIALKTGDLCGFLGVPYVYTRTDENSLDFDENESIRANKVADTRARTNLVNNLDDALEMYFSVL